MFLARLLLQNGLAFYLTWLSLVTFINFAIYISYGLSANQATASTITLGLILGIILVYFIIENFIWQRFLLYVVSPWFVLLVTYNGILTANWQTVNLNRNNIISLATFVVIVVCFAIKLLMICLYKTFCSHRYDKYKETLHDLSEM